MNAFKFWKQTCCKIGSRYRLRYYTSLAPLRSRITKPLVASPGNWYLGEAHIGGETVTVQSQSILDDHDLEQLCHGQFPANCEGEEIRLGKISLDNFRRIRAAFEARAEALVACSILRCKCYLVSRAFLANHPYSTAGRNLSGAMSRTTPSFPPLPHSKLHRQKSTALR